MANVNLEGPARESSWRRLAVASWAKPSDPTIYGLMDIDARAMLARIEAARAQGLQLTVTHLVGRALAEALKRCPEANVLLRGRRVWRRASVDVFMQVAVPAVDGDPAKAELSGVKIVAADQLDLPAFVERVRAEVTRTRERRDQPVDKTRARVAKIPRLLAQPILHLTRWLNFTLNLNLAWLGIAPDPFGSIMLTNVGMFGIETGFAPLYPIGGPSAVITLGAIAQQAVVDQGQIVDRPILRVAGTFDHRVFDGFQIAKFAKQLREILEVEVADAWAGDQPTQQRRMY